MSRSWCATSTRRSASTGTRSGLPVELVLPVPTDRVRIGFLPVGESKDRARRADRRHDRVSPASWRPAGRGSTTSASRSRTSPPRSTRLRPTGRGAHRPGAAGRCRRSGRIHPSPKRARRARGARRGRRWSRLGDRRLARWRCPVTEPSIVPARWAGLPAITADRVGHRPRRAGRGPVLGRRERRRVVGGHQGPAAPSRPRSTAPTESSTSRGRSAAWCCVPPVAWWP